MADNKVFTTAFKLMSIVDSSFKNGFSQAQKAFSSLEKAHISLDDELASLDGVLDARANIAKLKLAASEAVNAVLKINKSMGNGSNNKLSLAFDRAKEKAFRLRNELDKQKSALSELERKNGYLGQSTDVLASKQQKLIATFEKQRAAQSKLLSLSEAQANANFRAQNASAMVGSGVGNIAAAGASLTGLFAMPVNSAIKAEEELAELRKFSDQFEAISSLNTELSKKIAISTKEMVALQTAAMQSSILDPNDVKAVELYTTTAAKAMIALDLTGEEVGASFSEIKNKISGDMLATVKAFDLVNAISNQTSASGKDVLEVLSRTGGAVAALTHLDTNRVVALAGAFRAASNSAEVAATSQAAFINALMAGEGATKNQKEGYKKLGIDATKLAKAMVAGGKSAEAAIFDVFDRLGKLKDDEKSTIIGQIFGNEAGIKSAVATLSKQKDLLLKPFELANKESNFIGSMEAEYQSRASTTANQLVLLKNNTEALSSSFGSMFLPAVNAVAKSAINSLSPISKWIEGTTDNFAEQSKAILGVSTSLSELTAKGDYSTIDKITGGNRELLITISKVIGGLFAFKAAIGLSKIVMGAFLTPLNMLVKGYFLTRQVVLATILATKGYNLSLIASRVSTIAFVATQKAMSVAMLAVNSVLKVIRASFLAFNLVLMANPIGLVVTALGTLALAGVYLYTKFDVVQAKVLELIDSFKNKFPTAFSIAKAGFDAISYAVSLGVKAFHGILDIVSKFQDGLTACINFIKGVFSGSWSDAWFSIKDIFISIFDGLADFLLAPFKKVNDFLSNTKEAVVNSTSNLWQQTKDFTSNAANDFLNYFSFGDGDSANNNQGVSKTQAVQSNTNVSNIPLNIPALAEGGVVNKPTLALIGEGAQNEAVIPLNQLSKMLDMPAKSALSMPSINVSVSPVITINSNQVTSKQSVEAGINATLPDLKRVINQAISEFFNEKERLSL